MLRPTKVKHYLERMQQRGFTAARVLEGSQIDFRQLDSPTYLIDIWQVQKVLANILHTVTRTG